jgi:hypothetical protein
MIEFDLYSCDCTTDECTFVPGAAFNNYHQQAGFLAMEFAHVHPLTKASLPSTAMASVNRTTAARARAA